MQVHHIRSATMLLSIGPHHLLVDPMLSPPGALPGFKLFGGGRRANPLVPLPQNTDDILAQTTGVVVTHEHPDHLDPAAVAWIWRASCQCGQVRLTCRACAKKDFRQTSSKVGSWGSQSS